MLAALPNLFQFPERRFQARPDSLRGRATRLDLQLCRGQYEPGAGLGLGERLPLDRLKERFGLNHRDLFGPIDRQVGPPGRKPGLGRGLTRLECRRQEVRRAIECRGGGRPVLQAGMGPRQ